MPENRLVAEPRTEFGKGAARRVRRANKVPAVLYGHGEKPRHISLEGHAAMLVLRGDINKLITLEMGDGSTELVIPRAVVRDPIKGFLEHIDLLIVRRGERISIELAVSIVGDTAPGALPTLQHSTIHVEAEATHLPEALELNVEGMAAGTHIAAGDIALPEGVTLLIDPTENIVTVGSSTLAAENAELEAELQEQVAEAAADAEGDAPAEEAPEAPAEDA